MILRPPGPGDSGWIVSRHGALYAAGAGYARIMLWTVTGLEASRRLYGRAGFTLDVAEGVFPYDTTRTEQVWSRPLHALAGSGAEGSSPPGTEGIRLERRGTAWNGGGPPGTEGDRLERRGTAWNGGET